MLNQYLIDENECEQEPCHPNSTCTNTNGSYLCTCMNNFFGNGTFCEGTPIKK